MYSVAEKCVKYKRGKRTCYVKCHYKSNKYSGKVQKRFYKTFSVADKCKYGYQGYDCNINKYRHNKTPLFCGGQQLHTGIVHRNYIT